MVKLYSYVKLCEKVCICVRNNMLAILILFKMPFYDLLPFFLFHRILNSFYWCLIRNTYISYNFMNKTPDNIHNKLSHLPVNDMYFNDNE